MIGVEPKRTQQSWNHVGGTVEFVEVIEHGGAEDIPLRPGRADRAKGLDCRPGSVIPGGREPHRIVPEPPAKPLGESLDLGVGGVEDHRRKTEHSVG
jgi:hypothetical protein